MSDTYTAACECGAVQFRSERPPVVQFVCHCSDCREALGRPFAQTAFFEVDHVTISGDVVAMEFTVESGKWTSRERCPQCTSVIFDRAEGFPTLVGVMAERLAAPYAFEPACHVWTKSKASGVVIPDGMKCYEENFG